MGREQMLYILFLFSLVGKRTFIFFQVKKLAPWACFLAYLPLFFFFFLFILGDHLGFRISGSSKIGLTSGLTMGGNRFGSNRVLGIRLDGN